MEVPQDEETNVKNTDLNRLNSLKNQHTIIGVEDVEIDLKQPQAASNRINEFKQASSKEAPVMHQVGAQ
jgi:hypothetical protein